MPPPLEPFLDAATFAARFRPLKAAEELEAASLLEVVSRWIREHKPGIAADDPAAIVVSFEVTRDALLYGKYRPLSSFAEEVGHRSKSGTMQFREIEKFITGRHRDMLGLSSSPRPVYYFGD